MTTTRSAPSCCPTQWTADAREVGAVVARAAAAALLIGCLCVFIRAGIAYRGFFVVGVCNHDCWQEALVDGVDAPSANTSSSDAPPNPRASCIPTSIFCCYLFPPEVTSLERTNRWPRRFLPSAVHKTVWAVHHDYRRKKSAGSSHCIRSR